MSREAKGEGKENGSLETYALKKSGSG